MDEEMHKLPDADEVDADEAPNKLKKKKGVRGPTLSNKIKKASAKIPIEFNSKGEIISPYARGKVADWQGLIAKTMVPLSKCQKWSEYTREFKDDLWAFFLKQFDVDPKYRKRCLQCIGVCWRNFKNALTTHIILPCVENPELLQDLPQEYDFLNINDWRSFVKSRLTDEFQELSNLQSERRQKNQYNHRLSRKGYAGLKEDMEKVTGKPYDGDRSQLWLLARQDRNGHYKNEATREIAEKIVELKKEVKDGTLVVEGTNDVLTMALGNGEHDGRVRGVGKYFTPTTYFDIPRRTSKTKKLQNENEELKSKLKAYEAMLINNGLLDVLPSEKVASNSARSDNRRIPSFDDHIYSKKIGENGGKATSRSSVPVLQSKPTQVQGDPTKVVPSAKFKRMPDQDFIRNENKKKYKQSNEEPLSNVQPKHKMIQPCRLALDSRDNIVARGSVFESMGVNETLHSVPLGKENVRVLIAVADKPKAPLPVPIGDEYLTVGSAIGVPVAWPRKLVISGIEDVEEENELAKEDRRQLEVNQPMSKDYKVASEEPFSNALQKYKKVQPCRLALNSRDKIVAKGSVFESLGVNETIHSVPLGKENVRVCIVVADKPKALLPIPIGDEYLTVGSAIGVPVAWPRKFVIVSNEDVVEENEFINEDRRQPEMKRLREVDEDYDDNHHIKFTEFSDMVRELPTEESILPMDKGIFELETMFNIAKDEILDICNMNWLNANCIIAYIRLLYETYESSRDAYGFCYLADISRFAENKKEKTNGMHVLVKDRLLKRKAGQVIFLPYSIGNHWVLIMIDVDGKEIYYFDSNGGKPPQSIKRMMTTAMIHLSTEEKRRLATTSWTIAKCPIQPGNVECGYYVMSFMKHFMEDPTKPIKTKMMELANKNAYTEAELTEIRTDLINHVMSSIT